MSRRCKRYAAGTKCPIFFDLNLQLWADPFNPNEVQFLLFGKSVFTLTDRQILNKKVFDFQFKEAFKLFARF